MFESIFGMKFWIGPSLMPYWPSCLIHKYLYATRNRNIWRKYNPHKYKWCVGFQCFAFLIFLTCEHERAVWTVPQSPISPVFEEEECIPEVCDSIKREVWVTRLLQGLGLTGAHVEGVETGMPDKSGGGVRPLSLRPYGKYGLLLIFVFLWIHCIKANILLTYINCDIHLDEQSVHLIINPLYTLQGESLTNLPQFHEQRWTNHSFPH